MLSEAQIISTLKALADPNRLRLFELLLRSDKTNSELMEQTSLRQNLLSHHLNILCASGLIRTSRSVGDARRHYYSADLRMARAFGEWWQRRTPSCPPALPALRRPGRVLFLCQRNAARSMMAEALTRHLVPQSLTAYSAGIEGADDTLPPVVISVLAERQVSTAGLTAKLYNELPATPFDYLISVCDIVHENAIPDNVVYRKHVHWSLRDPFEQLQNQAEQLRLVRDLYDEIVLRLCYFVQRLAAQESES